MMKVTYFLEIMSSWCLLAQPTWTELKQRYAGQVEFEWKIALMNPADFPDSREQCDWYYRRSGTITRSPVMLNSGWVEVERKGDYVAPNLVAEAGRALGVGDDRLRLALSQVALRDGKRIGGMDAAIAVAAEALGLDAGKLRAVATSSEIARKVQDSTAEFHALQITQRPAFLLDDEIGDRAVFSGLIGLAPLTATIDAMLADTRAYASYAAHFGKPPLS